MELLSQLWRRWFNRNEWLVRLLDVEKPNNKSFNTCLIIVQIDGLSHKQIRHALAQGHMPFLHRLIEDKHYRLHDLYSGLPSNTPAVQAELFYGVKTAVPAFSFLDRTSGKIMRMYEPHSAIKVEHDLVKDTTKPLLKGGSCYADVYTGGATEAHFCPASMGWSSTFKTPRSLAIVFFIAINAHVFLRTLMLLIIESGLAIVDCLRGIIQGRNLLRELLFVPTRVAVCILLRELITIGVKIDIARGLPIIHLNLLAYDEQAHRRGPTSKFAHWSLKGIDHAIARIGRAAQHSNYRDYSLWIYSDHGQEDTRAYEESYTTDVKLAINKIFSQVLQTPNKKSLDIYLNQKNFSLTNLIKRVGLYKTQPLRVQILGNKYLQKILLGGSIDNPNEDSEVVVTAMGPIGMVYFPNILSPNQLGIIARACVIEANIPLIFIRSENGKVRAWNKHGEYVLPDDRAIVLGSNHPFLTEVTEDLISLCHHPNAGDLIICGWNQTEVYYTFSIENGSHAGPGPEETHAFALLPGDTKLPLQRTYLRPLDIRQAALHHLQQNHH